MYYFIQIQALADKNNFWGISYDAWFTGLTPILIFILGYIINEIIKNYNEKKRLRELEKYFKNLIELLNKPLHKQIEEFLKFSHLLKEKKEQHLILNTVTNFHVEQIKEISSKDLYSIFIKNKKGNISEKTELYGKLRANIDLIDQVKKSIRNDFLRFWEKYDKYQTDFKIATERLDYLFRVMISQSKSITLQQDILLSGMDNIRSELLGLKKENIKYTDMYVAKQMFLDPMKNLCNQNIRDSRSAIILKEISSGIYAFNDIEETKKVFRRRYLLLAKKLQNSWFEINSTFKRIDSL